MTAARDTIIGSMYVRDGAWPGEFFERLDDPTGVLERKARDSSEEAVLAKLKRGGIPFDRVDQFETDPGVPYESRTLMSVAPDTELYEIAERPEPRPYGKQWTRIKIAPPPSIATSETQADDEEDAEDDWLDFVAGLDIAAGAENATESAHLDRLIGPMRKTGAYTATQMSNETYHESGAISASGLKEVERSVDHYVEKRRNPKVSATFDLGTAIHDLVLEGGANFGELFVMRPDDDRGNFRKAEGKAWRDEQLAAGKRILDAEQSAAIEACSDAIFSHPEAAALLSVGEAEVSYFWEEVVDGVAIPCRVRPDWHMPGVLTDLKTARDAGHSEFARAMVKYSYDCSLAFYCRGIEVVTGRAPDAVFVIAVEKVAPYGIAVYDIDEQWLARGRALYMERLAAVARWLKTPEGELWTGYPAEVQTLEMPRWARRRE